jgi:hypothetical protein
MVRINDSFYNGIPNDKKYLYGQQVYIPESFPAHYYNSKNFSPIYLAEMRRQKKQEENENEF